jgi:hypothetical protein
MGRGSPVEINNSIQVRSCVSCTLPLYDVTVGGEREAVDHSAMLNSKSWMATSSVHDGHFKKDSHLHSNEYKQGNRKKNIPLLFTFMIRIGV